jgi:hypothetical protein
VPRLVSSALAASVLLLGACGAPPADPAAIPAHAFRGRLTLLSHAHDPLELLVFERKASRPLVQGLADALEKLNREAAAHGRPPVALSILRFRRDPSDPIALEAEVTPVSRIAVEVRFDVWLQDFAEIATSRGRTWLLAPHRPSGGLERIAPLLAERWGAGRVSLPRDAEGAANGAGNVEALPDGWLLLGSTAGPGLEDFLSARGYAHRLARIDTSFLAVGHVDELVSHVVIGPGECAYALVRASPRLGLDLLRDDPAAPRALRRRRTDRFERTQAVLEARITASLAELRARQTERVAGCPEVPIIALPVLFECKGALDAPRACRSLLPNPVNMTVLRRHALVPDPGHVPFRRAVETALRSYGQVPHFLDARFHHERRGGVHCATNVRRDPQRRWSPEPDRAATLGR